MSIRTGRIRNPHDPRRVVVGISELKLENLQLVGKSTFVSYGEEMQIGQRIFFTAKRTSLKEILLKIEKSKFRTCLKNN